MKYTYMRYGHIISEGSLPYKRGQGVREKMVLSHKLKFSRKGSHFKPSPVEKGPVLLRCETINSNTKIEESEDKKLVNNNFVPLEVEKYRTSPVTL